MRAFGAALREHLHRAKLIIYGSLLVVGVVQIVVRKRFPEVQPPWPWIGGALMVVLLGVLFVPPLLVVVRVGKRAESGKHP